MARKLKKGDVVRFHRPDDVSNTVQDAVGIVAEDQPENESVYVKFPMLPTSISCHAPWLTLLLAPDPTSIESIEQFLQEAE